MTAQHEIEHLAGVSRSEPGKRDCATARLALIRIRDNRRAKFEALVARTELFTDDPARRFYSPWCAGPQSIHGLVQGIYASFGIAAFWREQRHSACHGSGWAHAEFARRRVQLTEAMVAATNSGLLTEAGQRVLAELARAVRSWGEHDVPAVARRAAAESLLAHRIHWRVRNLVVDSAAVTALVADWDAGREPRDPAALVAFADQRRIPEGHRKLVLAGRLIALGTDVPVDPGQLAGDRAYLAGYPTEAMALYQRELRADPARPQAWAGYALAASKIYGRDDFEGLIEHPEVVSALYGVVGPDVEILALVRWLARTRA